MTRRSTSILLGVLALIGGGLMWTTIGGIGGPSEEETSASPSDASRATQETASEISLARPLHDDSSSAASDATAIAPSEVPEAHRESAALPPADLELRDALWIEGRVLVPAGTPADEVVEVVANGRRFATRTLHSSPIAADGSFRVAFARGTRLGTLDLSAKYLYMNQAFTLTPAQPPPEIVLAPHLGCRIHGRVVLSSAALSLRSAIAGNGFARADGPEGRFVREGRIDANLEFDLPALPFGVDYGIRVFAPGCNSPPLRNIKVEMGRTTFVDYELDLAAAVSGRVLDANGLPANQAQVLARLMEARAPGSRLHELTQTFSDPAGRFEFRQLPPGMWELTVTGLGFAKSLPHCVHLSAGRSVENVQLELRRSGRVAGRVLGVDGKPAVYALVRVVAHPPRDLELEGSEFTMGNALTTDKRGDFAFESVGPGSYRIEVGWADPANGGEASHPAFQLAEGESVEDIVIRIERPGRVEGRVTNADGQPAEGVPVSLRSVEMGIAHRGSCTSDASGTFALEGVRPGEYFVVVHSDRMAVVGETRIALRPGEAVQTQVVVRAATIVHVSLHGFAEEAGPVTVSILDEKESAVDTAAPHRTWDEGGGRGSILVCTLGPVLPGSYVVEAVAGGQTIRRPLKLAGQVSEKIRLGASD